MDFVRSIVIPIIVPIVVALIGLSGVIYKDTMLSWFAGAEVKRLAGEWACAWTVEEGEHEGANPIQDTLTFSVITDRRIKGLGHNSTYGPYEFEGRNSDFAVTLTYGGKRTNENFIGTAILLKQPQAGLLIGSWRQFGRDGKFVGGSVRCQKQE